MSERANKRHTPSRISPEYPLWRILGDEIEMRGLKQTDVAARMGVSVQYVCDMIKGRRNVPPLTLNKFIRAFGNFTPQRSRELHRIGARQAGWEIGP